MSIYHLGMNPLHDVARVRFENAMLLFDEFVQATLKSPDAATLRGLERRFAERLQIQPSYWSQIKSRSRQIGERLARQFEQLCRKPAGWMDQPAGGATGSTRTAAGAGGSGPRQADALLTPGDEPVLSPSQPQDDDERFIVGLVLTFYRRHPQRARTRLLDLLGEVLIPAAIGAAPSPAPTPTTAPAARTAPGIVRRSPPTPMSDDLASDLALWARSQTGVAPLKRKT
jgi:hypothetical protein